MVSCPNFKSSEKMDHSSCLQKLTDKCLIGAHDSPQSTFCTYTVRKFKEFNATQILREIIIDKTKASKTITLRMDSAKFLHHENSKCAILPNCPTLGRYFT